MGCEKLISREEDGEVDTAYVFDGLDSSDRRDHRNSTDIEVELDLLRRYLRRPPPSYAQFYDARRSHDSLVVTDKAGAESFARTMTVRIANPPSSKFEFLTATSEANSSPPPRSSPRSSIPDGWSHTFNEDGAVVTAPERMLYFDSSGTRDDNRQFEGKYVPFETESPDWNGLVQYTWDFGDATPLVHDATPWHAYTLPGTYIVSLTVRDGFGTGDVSRETFTVIVDHPPEAREIYVPENIFAGSSISFDADVFDTESGMEMEIYRDLDVEDDSITERDERIATEFTVRWDFDIETDLDEDGDAMNDWVTPIAGSSVRTINTWEATGYYTLLVEICTTVWDSVIPSHRTSKLFQNPRVRPRSQEFSAEEWKSWLADAGSELATFLALIVVALILGWLVMREPSSVEEEAKEAAETYTDIEHVETQGGLLGMDHHMPPPGSRFCQRKNVEAMTADMFVRCDVVEAMS